MVCRLPGSLAFPPHSAPDCAAVIMTETMNGRLITAIVSTIAEEAAALILGLWLLPRAGIDIPWPVIAGLMALWLGWSIFTYQKGTHALRRKPVNGLADMKGMTGETIKAMQPEGVVKIHGELWSASSVTGHIREGTKVIVVARNGLKLSVRPADSGDSLPRVQE
jgi:membrane-bound ClpP family serine protease